MDASVGFGVIGCGTMGERHAECIVDAEGASLVAVCDIDRQRAESVGKKFGAPAMSDLDAFLAFPGLEAAIVALPSHLHAEIGMRAARGGKHVMVEKPIDLSVERARKLIEVCKDRGVALSVISQHRFHPDVLFLKQAIGEGKLGRLILCSAQSEWNRDQDYYEKAPGRGLTDPAEGGAMLNQAVHYIDLLLWLCGTALRVAGFKATLTHRIAVEDVAAVCLEFESGALGTITASTSVAPQQPEKVEAHGERGTVVVESGKIVAWQVDGCPRNDADGAKEPFKPKLAPVRKQLEDFAHAIRHQRPPLVTGQQGLAVLATILAAYRLAQTRRTETVVL